MVGDMISVIDMPPPEESIWWRGKRGFQVGFFPCECVQVIGDKVPQSIQSHNLSLPPMRLTTTVTGTTTTITTTATTFTTTTLSMLPGQGHSSLQGSFYTTGGPAHEPLKPVLRKHGKLIAFFRSFILSRPSRRKLKQSGILRERVFGCDLGENLINSCHDIPMVLKCCAQFIETHGTVDGIYRLSGITSNIQKLRNAFDEERVPELYGDESILQDIHCVSSLLKMYFRELPNPLLTYQLYNKFATAVMQEEDVRLLHIRDVIQQLPPPHYRTLEYLVRHLARIAAHSPTTGMTPKNIAIVWAPNLLRSKDLEKGGVAALQDIGTQAVVTEYLIRYVELIFNDKFPNLSPLTRTEVTHRSTRPKSLAISTPAKLISIDEARSRALAALKTDQNYIEVGGGPRSLPKTYHTIIDLPSRKGGSLKHKKSPSGWKTLFSKSRYHRKSSTPCEIPLNLFGSGVLSKEASHLPPKILRPVKSVESLVSTPMSLHSISQGINQVDKQKRQEKRALDIEEKEGSFSDSSSPLPSPRTHSRSVSHDSYFNMLERSTPTIAQTGTVKEERESELEFSPDSPKTSLELGLSELNMDFNMSEPEMRIFSEDETLQSTSLEDTISRSTVDMENISMGSDCTRSKDSLSCKEKRTLKDKLRHSFASSQKRTADSSPLPQEDHSRNNSLKCASLVIKDKITHSLTPETTRKKDSSHPRSISPTCSPKIKHVKEVSEANEKILSVDGSWRASMENKDVSHYSTQIRLQESLDSILIEPDLLKKITQMKISPSASVSDASSISLADATVSDNESFTLGSTSSGALVTSGLNGIAKGLVDSGSSLSHSAVATPLTLSVPIVLDFSLQEDCAKPEMVKSFEENSLRRNGDELGKGAHVKRDRPSSLLGLPTSELLSLGSLLVSPETPQGDSTFLEIQYDPLSDTTEPSTPSETHFGVPSRESAENISQVQSGTKHSSPLSPDISSSSTDDPIDNAPMYENVEVGSSLPLTRRLLDCDETNVDSFSSNSKPSPEVETPTPADSEYENIKYHNLELSPHYDSDPRNIESETATPCYENIEVEFPQHYPNMSAGELCAVDQEEGSLYENVETSPDAYEDYSFNDPTEYENLEFTKEYACTDIKTEAEIEGEMVYQQVKYLKKTIEEVNVILSKESDKEPNIKPEPLIRTHSSEDGSLLLMHDPADAKSNGSLSLDNNERHQSDGSECLESPVTPSSSSVITEMLVLPSFSSPTESTTEEVTSPDASETHPSPQAIPTTHSTLSRKICSPVMSVSSPPSFPPLLPSLSPPSPESPLPMHSVSNNAKLQSWKKICNSPTALKRPTPKPRSLPTLNVASPIVSPSSTSSSISPDSPASPGTPSDSSPGNAAAESTYAVSFSSHAIVPRCSTMPCNAEISNEREESTTFKCDSSSSCPKVPLSDNVKEANTSATSPPHNASLKRERIDKIKEERRSFLRKKFPSESFKGEKDEMIMRLKQKATSPSRQLDSDSDASLFAEAEVMQTKSESELDNPPKQSGKSETIAPVSDTPFSDPAPPPDTVFGVSSNGKSCEVILRDKDISSEKFMRFHSSDYAHSRNIFDITIDASSNNLRKEKPNALHRSISEDLRPDLPLVKKFVSDDAPQRSSSASYKPNNIESHIESNYRYRKSSSPGQSKESRDDVNVKERVAIWSRHEETGSNSARNKLPLRKVESSPSEPKPKALSPVKVISQPFFCQQIKPEKPPIPGLRRSLGSLSSSLNDKPIEAKANISRLQKVYDSSADRKELSCASPLKASKPNPLSPTRLEPDVGSHKSDSRIAPTIKIEKDLSTEKSDLRGPSTLIKSAPHSPKRASPILLSQKSEGDLHGPVSLRTTRSYSVGSPSGTAKMHHPPLLTHGHRKKIKDIAARFEKEPLPPSTVTKPPPILRQSSKD